MGLFIVLLRSSSLGLEILNPKPFHYLFHFLLHSPRFLSSRFSSQVHQQFLLLELQGTQSFQATLPFFITSHSLSAILIHFYFQHSSTIPTIASVSLSMPGIILFVLFLLHLNLFLFLPQTFTFQFTFPSDFTFYSGMLFLLLLFLLLTFFLSASTPAIFSQPLFHHTSPSFATRQTMSIELMPPSILIVVVQPPNS